MTGTIDLRKEYTVTLARWERYETRITVKAINESAAIRLARSAAKAIDYNGWTGEAEVDNTTQPKIERNIIDVEVVE